MASLAIAFSTANFHEMLAEAQQQTGASYLRQSADTLCSLERDFGSLSIRHTHLRAGLSLRIQKWTLKEPLSVITSTQNYAAYEFNFCLSGEFRSLFQSATREIVARPANSFTSSLKGNIDVVNEYGTKSPVLVLTISLSPALFEEIVPEALQDIQLNNIFIQTDHSEISGTLGATTPAMLTALQQILHCPHQGAIKRLYLESKALELIALKLSQIKQAHSQKPLDTRLKADDIQRIYMAKEILLREIEQPPSIVDLAKRVKINDCKLKQGFRQVFGTTVFGCLSQHRMERAKQLLETQDFRVAQVAQAVGYANPSKFSAAFKRQFGFTPKAYKSLQ